MDSGLIHDFHGTGERPEKHEEQKPNFVQSRSYATRTTKALKLTLVARFMWGAGASDYPAGTKAVKIERVQGLLADSSQPKDPLRFTTYKIQKYRRMLAPHLPSHHLG